MSGLGISILPVDIVEEEVAANKLKRILPECALPLVTLFFSLSRSSLDTIQAKGISGVFGKVEAMTNQPAAHAGNRQ